MKRWSIMSLTMLGLISSATLAAAANAPAPTAPAQDTAPLPSQDGDDYQDDEDVIIMEDDEDYET